jgi:hypothetical protein
VKTMRLRCQCGRNLADVEYDDHNRTWTADRLTVTARPNVDMDSFRPWAEYHRRVPVDRPPPGRNPLEELRERHRCRLAGEEYTGPPPWRPTTVSAYPPGADADWHARTYTWRCKCGAPPINRRHERISAAWQRYVGDERPLVILVLGRDL